MTYPHSILQPKTPLLRNVLLWIRSQPTRRYAHVDFHETASSLLDKHIAPYSLQESWMKDLVLLSSAPEHLFVGRLLRSTC